MRVKLSIATCASKGGGGLIRLDDDNDDDDDDEDVVVVETFRTVHTSQTFFHMGGVSD